MFRRNVHDNVCAALADTPVVFLAGARQTGKTTLVRSLASEIGASYATLDDPPVLSAAMSDPQGFLQGLGHHAIIDEAQKAPGVFPVIKAAVDRDRKARRYLLTGSANVLLLPRIAESLAGRMEIITLGPLSQGEIEGRRERFIDAVFSERRGRLVPGETTPDVVARVAAGGFPEALGRSDEKRRRAWWSAYVTAILQRDVRDIANIEGLVELPRLLRLLAARTGSLLNFSELARAAAMPQTTLKRYLALLEATFLLAPLPAWSSNLSKRLIKSPKLHLVDSGLAAHLMGLNAQRLREDPQILGHLLENFVVAELRRQAAWQDTAVECFHFRALHSQREVDVVLEDDAGRLAGIEIKATATPMARDFAGLREFADSVGNRFHAGIVLCLAPQSVPFGDRLRTMPIGALWQST